MTDSHDCHCPDPQEDGDGICESCGGKVPSPYPEVRGLNRHQMHKPNKCAGHYCSIHNPSNHHMKDWPLVWRRDTLMMERTCPHGVGHPDPDHLAFAKVHAVTRMLEGGKSSCPDNVGPAGDVCFRCGYERYEDANGHWVHYNPIPCRRGVYETSGVHGCDGCCCPPRLRKAEGREP